MLGPGDFLLAHVTLIDGKYGTVKCIECGSVWSAGSTDKISLVGLTCPRGCNRSLIDKSSTQSTHGGAR